MAIRTALSCALLEKHGVIGIDSNIVQMSSLSTLTRMAGRDNKIEVERLPRYVKHYIILKGVSFEYHEYGSLE